MQKNEEPPVRSSQTDWQKEDSKIIFRDLFFVALVIIMSILFAEQFLLKEKAELVDRIFAYVLIFIPLGIINLIAHYFYRNRRIRVTGNLRTSLRYRLSLAFMFVAIVPSIPIFLISSNMVEELVKGIFRIDVGQALDTAAQTLKYYQQEESGAFLKRIRERRVGMFLNETRPQVAVNSLFQDHLLIAGRDYAGILKNGKIVYEKGAVFKGEDLPVFTVGPGADHAFRLVFIKGMDLQLFRFPMKNENEFLLIGHRLHPGLEEPLHQFESTHAKFMEEEVWREKIPTFLRLGLGLIYIFMIALSLFLAHFIARRISMPIVSLAQATRDVSEGKLDTRLEIEAQGEMGILIDAFNQMTGELRSLRARLLHSQRMAAWREVARRLAHEIKNPLTPIQLSAERMVRRLERPGKGDLNQIIRSGAGTIVEQVNVLKSLVSEFADFARMPVARPEPASLDNIVAEAVKIFEGSANLEIELKLDGKLPEIPIDKNLLIGMINNLIKNAIEAIESQGPEERSKPSKVRVSTGLFRRGIRRFVMLKVEDNGPGIEEQMKDRVFEPYFTTKQDSHGSGLGLALVERCVLEHDAQILVGRSSLGGAEFTILFRLRAY